MCYSAMVRDDFSTYLRTTGAQMDFEQFREIYGLRAQDSKIKIPRAVDRWFQHPKTEIEQEIRRLIDQFRAAERMKLERELFSQKTRLTNAERKLLEKPTKTATKDKQVATDKIAKAEKRLPLLRDFAAHVSDGRIFPMNYAPIVLRAHDRNVVRLARYHCRQAGKPASIDKERDGLYNARRDNITRFWRNEFGHTHALMLTDSFYENVDREGKNAVLHFVPNPAGLMLIACLYSQWQGENAERLLSFAAITDEPPAEVAAAGHDRMIVNIQPENVEAWLNPEGHSVDELQRILTDRQKPYYEHSVMAA